MKASPRRAGVFTERGGSQVTSDPSFSKQFDVKKFVLRLHPEPSAVAAVRIWVQDHCLALQNTDLCQDVVLIASELVTNAIRHAGTELLVEVEQLDQTILLAVTDKSPRPVNSRHAS